MQISRYFISATVNIGPPGDLEGRIVLWHNAACAKMTRSVGIPFCGLIDIHDHAEESCIRLGFEIEHVTKLRRRINIGYSSSNVEIACKLL